MRPQQHENGKKNRIGLDNVQQDPDNTASKKKDAQPDKDPTEQGQGPVDRKNDDVSTGT